MANTNMDIRKNPEATAPILEFTLPKAEVEEDVTVGQRGEVIIPVEVIAVEGSTITFRKNNAARSDKMFQQEPLADMRERVGVVEDTEEPMSEKEEK